MSKNMIFCYLRSEISNLLFGSPTKEEKWTILAANGLSLYFCLFWALRFCTYRRQIHCFFPLSCLWPTNSCLPLWPNQPNVEFPLKSICLFCRCFWNIFWWICSSWWQTYWGGLLRWFDKNGLYGGLYWSHFFHGELQWNLHILRIVEEVLIPLMVRNSPTASVKTRCSWGVNRPFR